MSNIESMIPVLICVLLVAVLYSSVGHGGASGYLAIMTIFSFDTQILRSSALVLNILVSGIAFVQYYRRSFFRSRLFFPFAATSVPFAFLGGLISLDPSVYKKILSICLLFAVFRMTLNVSGKDANRRGLPITVGFITGAVLGLISGIIGVGGGIFLSPILLLLHWADMKETAAVSALFIFVNSIAGLVGILSTRLELGPEILVLVPAAVIGGIIGSNIGSTRISGRVLRYVLSLVLIFASVKLFLF